jgi:hypothetical protein
LVLENGFCRCSVDACGCGAGSRSISRFTCTADHWPSPRAVGIPRSLRPAAIPEFVAFEYEVQD